MRTLFMPDVPLLTRLYVASVIVVGGLVFASALPPEYVDPGLFVVLLTVAVIGSALKITVPLQRGGLTLSVSFACIFTAVLLLDRSAAMTIAGMSAWTQCTYRPREVYPIYRTLFSVATVILSAGGASVAYTSLGGSPTLMPVTEMLVPVLAAGAAFFLINSFLVAGAITLATGLSFRQVWLQSLLGSAPTYLVEALASTLVALLVLHDAHLLAPALAVPLYLNYRLFERHVARLTSRQLA